MVYVVDFCAYCLQILPEGLGLESNPKCPNCDSEVKDSVSRVRGEFTQEDYHHIKYMLGEE